MVKKKEVKENVEEQEVITDITSSYFKDESGNEKIKKEYFNGDVKIKEEIVNG